mgnify:CR=1 FL=1
MPALLVVYKPYDLPKTPIKQEQVKIDQIPVTKIETPKTNNDDRNVEPVKEPVKTITPPASTDEREEPAKTVIPDPNKVEDTKPVVEEVELTPSFIDLTKITPEQRIRLQNSVSGIKVEDLVSKVNNINDK